MDLARSEFLRFVAAPNESLRLIIIYYMFKYSFEFNTTFLESIWTKKKAVYRLDLAKTGYKHLYLARSEFLSFVAAPNESQKLIILYYMFKYTFGIKKNFARLCFNTK